MALRQIAISLNSSGFVPEGLGRWNAYPPQESSHRVEMQRGRVPSVYAARPAHEHRPKFDRKRTRITAPLRTHYRDRTAVRSRRGDKRSNAQALLARIRQNSHNSLIICEVPLGSRRREHPLTALEELAGSMVVVRCRSEPPQLPTWTGIVTDIQLAIAASGTLRSRTFLLRSGWKTTTYPVA